MHSVVGAGPLILHKMNAEGMAVWDDGQVIARDPKMLPTLEGPKIYKRNGYYYIFAPIGGVSRGSQAVLRSKNIYGPYESRVVLERGATAINGPHQGGYVETASGQGWFLHFQQRGAYGRIVHLQPVKRIEDWPVMGDAGQPVAAAKKPDVGRVYPIREPQTSDEFTAPRLGLQWEWNHNPDDARWSLSERPGFLRNARHDGGRPGERAKHPDSDAARPRGQRNRAAGCRGHDRRSAGRVGHVLQRAALDWRGSEQRSTLSCAVRQSSGDAGAGSDIG